MSQSSWEDSVRSLGGDPDFVWFLCEEKLPIWSLGYVVPGASEKLRANEHRRLKRQLQKGDPAGWRDTWRRVVRPFLKGKGKKLFLEGKLEVRIRHSSGGLAEIAVSGPRPSGRPTDPRWSLVWLLRAYFRELTGHPKWSLIAEIISARSIVLQQAQYDRQLDYDALQAGWQRHKKEFEGWDEQTAKEFMARLREAAERQQKDAKGWDEETALAFEGWDEQTALESYRQVFSRRQKEMEVWDEQKALASLRRMWSAVEGSPGGGSGQPRATGLRTPRVSNP